MSQDRVRLARAARACALASATLALACQARPDPQPLDADEHATPAPAEPPSARAEPPSAPAEPPFAPTASAPAEPPFVGAPPPTFSLALLRDGPLHLRSVGDRALLLVDGEVVQLGPDGPLRDAPPLAPNGRPRGPDGPTRDARPLATSPGPNGPARSSRPLLTPANGQPLAYAETPTGDAWLVTGRTNPRAGGLRDVAVHRRHAGRWTAVPTGGEPGLLHYYAPLLARGDTVLGLHAVAAGGDLDDDTAAAAALARASRGFVRLSGPAGDIVPTLPDAWTLHDVAVATTDTIYALADRDDTTAVLAWSPDRSEPATIAVPPDLPPRARLSVTGSCLLLAGSRDLFVGRGGALERGDGWRRLTVDLSESTGTIAGPALCTDTGELWLTVEHAERREHGPQRRLLHRSAAGAWHPITLPPPDERLIPERSWIFDEDGWVEARPQPGHAEPPSIAALAWDGQRLWVLADFGLLVDVGSDNWLPGAREALYVGDALAHPPTVLPGLWERAFEQARRDRRAPGDCTPFTIALGTATLSDPQRAALRALATTSDDGGVDLLYIGELDGRRELVVQASADDRASAARLTREVGAAVGARLKADCRARRLIEAVEFIRDD